MAWRGVAWRGMAWCGVVWHGVVWCGVVWCGVVWHGVVWCGMVWCGVVRCGVAWCGVVWCGEVWCGVVWCGVVWCGVVWCGVVCHVGEWGGMGWHSMAFEKHWNGIASVCFIQNIDCCYSSNQVQHNISVCSVGHQSCAGAVGAGFNPLNKVLQYIRINTLNVRNKSTSYKSHGTIQAPHVRLHLIRMVMINHHPTWNHTGTT